MIDIIRVTKEVKRLTGTADDDTFDIVPVVSVACEELFDRLINKKSENDERVINAAVYLSYYRLVLRQTLYENAQTKFQAGDITISQSPEILAERAAVLRDEALCSASSLIKDMDFIFRQV